MYELADPMNIVCTGTVYEPTTPTSPSTCVYNDLAGSWGKTLHSACSSESGSGAGSGSSLTTGTGSFLFYKNYGSADCSGDITSVSVKQAGVCQYSYDTTYQKILISGDSFVFAFYSDSSCTTILSGPDLNYQSTSCNSIVSTYITSYQPSIALSYDLSALFGGSSDVLVT